MIKSLNNSENKPLVLKLGGSVISHSNKIIDFDYLREFRDLLREQVLLGKKFVVTIGGGQTCRNFMDHARENGNISNETDLHWIGTAANTLNAEMVRSFLNDEVTESKVWKYEDMYKISELKFEKPIVVAGGFEAGKSSDWVALRIAQALGAYRIFDLKSINGVYDSDPKTNPKAKFFPKLTWAEYINIIGNPDKHLPGGNLPVDPIAAGEAKELGAEYFIIKANDFDSIEAAINDQEFSGTIIAG